MSYSSRTVANLRNAHMNRHAHLAKLADFYVEALKGKPNIFAPNGSVLAATGARTQCSSFLRLLLEQAFGLEESDFLEAYGFARPRARDFAQALQLGDLFPIVSSIHNVSRGMLGAIGYAQDRAGMSGHCFVVAGDAVKTHERFGVLETWTLEVVDSCRSSHGSGDTRFVSAADERGGIGQGAMRILTATDGTIHGYIWSPRNASEVFIDGAQQTIHFGALPSFWIPQKDK